MAQRKVLYSALIGAVLAEERSLRDVSQGAAASAAGLTQSTWGRMELGRACTIENIAKACKAFHIQPWKLFKVADDRAEALAQQGVEVVLESPSEASDTAVREHWMFGLELSRISSAALAASSPTAALAVAAGRGIAGYVEGLFGKKP